MDEAQSTFKSSSQRPPPPRPLTLVVPGATTEQLDAGIAAALEFLKRHDLTLDDVAGAFGELEIWDDDGIDEFSVPPEGPMKLLKVWDGAVHAAIETAWTGPGEAPRQSQLVLFEAWS